MDNPSGPSFKAQVHDATPFAVAKPIDEDAVFDHEKEGYEAMRRRVQAKQELLELQRREAEIDQELGGSQQQPKRTNCKLIVACSVGVVILLASVLVGIICGTGNCSGSDTKESSDASSLGGAIPRAPATPSGSSPSPPSGSSPPPPSSTSSSALAFNVLCDRAIFVESKVQGDLELAAAASGYTELCHGHDRGTAHRDPGLFYVARAQGIYTTISVCGAAGDLSASVGDNGCSAESCAEQVQETRTVVNGLFCHTMDVASTPGSELTILVYGSGGTFELEIAASTLPSNAQCVGATSVQAAVSSPDRDVVQGDLTQGFVDTTLRSLCFGHDKGSPPSGPGLWYKFQALAGDFTTIQVCGTQRDLSISVSGDGGCTGGCADAVREERFTENGMFCHLMDATTSVADDIVLLVYGDSEEFKLQVYPSDLPTNAVCPGATFLPVTQTSVDQGTAGNLSLGFVDTRISSLCGGHSRGKAPTDPGLWYKTQATGMSAFTTLKVCGGVEDLSISSGTLCTGGCAEVVQETRIVMDGNRFCHQLDIEQDPGEEILAYVYGSTEVFDIQAFESTLPANGICGGAILFETSVDGSLSLGNLDSGVSNLCSGLNKGSAPSGAVLYYKFVASDAETTEIKVCGDSENISLDVSPDGCTGCVTLVSDTRITDTEGRFCHRLVAEDMTAGDETVVLVYGTADAFTLTVESSS